MAKDPEKKAELTEHLAELRARLVRSIIYVVAGAILAWCFYDHLFRFLVRPMADVLAKQNSSFLLTSFPEAFMIQLQICLVAGLIGAAPLLTAEMWGFVSPGLTASEKRPAKWLVPLAAVVPCTAPFAALPDRDVLEVV